MDDLKRKFIGLTQAAKQFGVSRSLLYKLNRAGQISFYRLGSKVLVNPEEINEKILASKSTVINGAS